MKTDHLWVATSLWHKNFMNIETNSSFYSSLIYSVILRISFCSSQFYNVIINVFTMTYLDNPKSPPASLSMVYICLPMLSCVNSWEHHTTQWGPIWGWKFFKVPQSSLRPVSYEIEAHLQDTQAQNRISGNIVAHCEPGMLLAFLVSSDPLPFFILKNHHKFPSSVTVLCTKQMLIK